MDHFHSRALSLIVTAAFLVLVLGMVADQRTRNRVGSSRCALEPGGGADCCCVGKDNALDAGHLYDPDNDDVGSPTSEADGCRNGFCSACSLILFLVSDSRFCQSTDAYSSQLASHNQLPTRIFANSLFRPPRS